MPVAEDLRSASRRAQSRNQGRPWTVRIVAYMLVLHAFTFAEEDVTRSSGERREKDWRGEKVVRRALFGWYDHELDRWCRSLGAFSCATCNAFVERMLGDLKVVTACFFVFIVLFS